VLVDAGPVCFAEGLDGIDERKRDSEHRSGAEECEGGEVEKEDVWVADSGGRLVADDFSLTVTYRRTVGIT